MRRSLIYFWRMNLAVALGAAVTTAVLTGALLVGDSVRGSLRDLTLDRLGGIDYCLVPQRFFREDLATDLAENPAFRDHFREVAPAILLGGSATHADSQARASKVGIQGIDPRFLEVFGLGPDGPPIDFDSGGAKRVFPPVVINQSLQKELGANIGDPILISSKKPTQIHPELLLGSRDPSDLLETIRLSLVQVIPDRGVGRFGLDPHQHLPFNAYLPLSVLQKALQQEGRVNALLVAQSSGSTPDSGTSILQESLRRVLQLQDLNLRLREGPAYFALESREMIIPPLIEEAAAAAAVDLQAPFQRILTYLANGMTARERAIPYSTVTAMDPSKGDGFGSLELTNGQPAALLGENDILLNKWAADDLSVKEGDLIELSYYVLGPREQLLTQKARFQLTGIVALKNLGVDRTLTPEIPGVQDAQDMAAWDPPVPIDLDRIRPKDEAYWDEFGAAPKAFVAYAAGLNLWSSRFGHLTSIRIGAAKDSNLESTQERFQRALLQRISPMGVGFVFQPVKEQGLRASAGATNFSMLFISFSFFLITSAVLLVGLLFRLGVEQRAREIGLLLSLGYPLKSVRRRFLAEGALVAGVGSLLGLAGAVAYAWLLIFGLRTWWSAAVGSPFLSFYVSQLTLIVGYLVSLAVVLFSIGWALRKLAQLPTPVLLGGGTSDPVQARAHRWVRVLALASLGLAMVLMLIAALTQATSSVGLFFGIGTSLLLAGLSFFSLWLRASHRVPIQPHRLALPVQIAARNSAWNPGRSLLSTALVASACFVIVSVGANRHEPGEELLRPDSGAGGFSLLAQSDIPVHQDLNDPEGRFDLGFSDSDSEKLSEVQIMPFRVLPGEDVSCLNLYQPQKPRILGVPPEQIARGGFQFQQLSEDVENPWTLLEQSLEAGVIPAVGDANSVLWILHLGLGKDLILQNERGEEIKLRLVGLLRSSIFQSELLISEANFLKHFPSQSGYSYFLIEAPLEKRQEIAALLESNLNRHGLDATSTAEVLASYLAVENTYLSTFQTLGGLGLLLGTLGLAIVLVRNVLERRAELATLRAFGFPRSKLAWMVLAENGFLLMLGLVLGTASALVAVAPHLAGGGAPIPWLSLSLTLLAVLVVGLAAGAAAVVAALRIPLLPALKAE